jgi:peptide chain release factor 2
MPAFWDDNEVAQRVLREKGALERVVRDWKSLATTRDDVATLLELAEEEQEESLLTEASEAAAGLDRAVRALEIRRLLSEKEDISDAIVEINAGAGGIDACDWADMLLRMYLRWAELRGFKSEIMDRQAAEEGIRSVVFAIRGSYAYGYLKAESGVHRLVRISPFDAQARRHTAFAAVAAYADLDDDIDVQINPADVEMQAMRSSGAGGQHVNTTDSAVRLTHTPTGIVVVCRAERSQHKNRDKAMAMLRAKIYQLEMDKRLEAQAEVNAKKKRIDFGSQIRSYVLQPYQQVKDLRTDVVTGNVDRVLDGDLDAFMEAWLAARAEGKMAEA